MKENVLRKLDNDTQDFARAQEETLLKILRDNQDTVYGKKYDFAHIRSAEEYRSRVPVTTYEDYKEYMERILEHGEKNVTSAYPIRYCMVSSGTTGVKKYVPMSDIGIDVYGRYAYECSKEMIKRHYKKQGVELSSKDVAGRIFLLNEIHCRRLDSGHNSLIVTNAVFQRRLEDGNFDYERYTSPHPVLFPEYEMDMNYLKLRYALADEQVTAIEGAYVHQVLNILYYMEQNWELLTDDIAAGVINPGVNVPKEVRSQLEPGLRPMPERAAQLRREFEKGFETPILQRIWKKMRFVMAVSGEAFDAYMQKLLRYIGNMPYHYLGYGASEGAFAPAAGIERPGEYVFAPELGYFEFVPEDEGGALNVCGIKDLAAGKKYEMIHTGYAGLYRYRMGDVLEVTGFYNSAPMVKFCYRREHCVNIAGEKMDLEKITKAVEEFAKTYDLPIDHFCIYPQTDAIPAKYIVLLEPRQSETPDVSIAEAALTMDMLLRRQNMDYDDCRSLKEIAAASVCFLKNGAADRYKEHLRRQGADVGQYKPVRIIDSREKKEFFFGEIVKAGLGGIDF